MPVPESVRELFRELRRALVTLEGSSPPSKEFLYWLRSNLLPRISSVTVPGSSKYRAGLMDAGEAGAWMALEAITNAILPACIDEARWRRNLTRDEIALVRNEVDRVEGPTGAGNEQDDSDRITEAVRLNDDLVTLDQASRLAKKTKRTFENYKGTGLPAPFVVGGPGQAALYRWSELRAFIMLKFNLPPRALPEAFPARLLV